MLIDFAFLYLQVDWRKGDALQPHTFADIFPDVDGVVHTLGILIEDSQYKEAVRQGNLLALASSFWRGVAGQGSNPLEQTNTGEKKNTYEVMNRDAGQDAFIAIRAFFFARY